MRFKPIGSRELQTFKYIVITETDEDRRPAERKWRYANYYHKGQIVVCNVTGGIPIEVGTDSKPGKLNCSYKEFEVLPEAIEYSYEVTNSGFNHQRRKRRRGAKRSTGGG